MHTNIHPVIIKVIVLFSCCGLSMGRGRGLLEYHWAPSQNSYVMFVISSVLRRGYMAIYWRLPHQKRTMRFSISWEEVSFLTRQRRLLVVRYRSGHQDRCPRLTPDYRHRRYMLAKRHLNWNHNHWPHLMFSVEFTLVNSDGCARLFRRVVKWLVDRCIQETGWAEWLRLTLNSSANITWDQCWWFQFWWPCDNMRRQRWWLIQSKSGAYIWVSWGYPAAN